MMQTTNGYPLRLVHVVAAIVLPVACVTSSARADDPAPTRQPPPGREVNLEQRADIGLAALNLYSTFGCIGLAAEGWEAELYKADKIGRIMEDVSRSSNLSVRLLKKALEDEPDLATNTPVREMIDCYVLLDRQAQLLREAAKSSDEGVLQAYRRVREESWQKIAAVLGVKE
jgi:hypothetical protein